ncbi:MAG: methyltransferase domain-containing protein, partial [Candidatus Pacebacteria bacterium]|nr:methyltransferase domain-containing protein [Candidatus Paceibacterota bacterium]
MEENRNHTEIISEIGSGGLINPDDIIKKINITSGMTVADFGCGAGYFTIPIAKLLTNSGKIYAIDVLSSALESVLSKAKLFGLLNIKTIRANVEIIGGSKIKDRSVNLVMLANILFQCNDYDSVLGEAKRIVKENGKIIIIDWVPKKVPLGPKFEHCLSEEDIKKISARNGLKIIKKLD